MKQRKSFKTKVMRTDLINELIFILVTRPFVNNALNTQSREAASAGVLPRTIVLLTKLNSSGAANPGFINIHHSEELSP